MQFFLYSAAALLVLLTLRLLLVFVRKQQFADYWRAGIRKPDRQGVLKLVVLGDSISQGVGASRISRSLVGRVTDYLQRQTGRDVQVKNYSRSGATAEDVVSTQLSQADLETADLVILEIGANDTKRITLQDYGKYLRQIMAKLPLEKTIIADVPYVTGRRAYQEKLEQALGENDVARAHFVPSLRMSSTWSITAGDFFHPNDKGYDLWFESFRPAIDQVVKRRSLLKEAEK